MVHKWCTAPKIIRSLAIDITNNEKASGTLPLGNCGCLPGPPHPPDSPPSSHLPSPHLGWGKTCLSGEFFLQTPYCATCASALEYSDDGLMDVYTYPLPVPAKKPEVGPHFPGFGKRRSCDTTSSELPRASDSKVTFQLDIPVSDDNSDDWVSNDSSNASTSSGEAFNKQVHDYYNHGFIAPEQKFDFIEHLSSIVLLLKLSNTTAVYEVLVDTHSCNCQLQIALIYILIYIINNDYFITTGLSMLVLCELQATILSNLCVNRAIHYIAQGGDLCFSLEPLDSLLVVAVPPVPSSGPPLVPFHTYLSWKQSPIWVVQHPMMLWVQIGPKL